VYFFHDHRGKPIVSPALFEPIGEKFRRDIKGWAQANGIPVITFKAGERKAEVMVPYLDAAAAAGRSQVVAVGCAQEFQLVWTARKRATDPGACPQFSFTKEQRRVSVFYVYIFDEQMGPGFIKICSYFPYPVKVWVNGHEWAKRQAAAAGIGFTALSNGFASCEDPAALQAICDRFGPGTVQVWFERWMARIPLPLDDADRVPWLEAMRKAILEWIAAGKNVVLACSALKRAYRDELRPSPEVRIIYLKGDYTLFAERIRQRRGHFAGEGILAGQFADLEEPTDAITIDAAKSAEQIVAEIRKRLSLS